MKNIIFYIFAFVMAFMAVFAFAIFDEIVESTPVTITNNDTIVTLNNASDNYFSSVKEYFAQEVEEDFGVVPQKVVIKISSGLLYYDWFPYTVYFKDSDGVWKSIWYGPEDIEEAEWKDALYQIAIVINTDGAISEEEINDIIWAYGVKLK